MVRALKGIAAKAGVAADKLNSLYWKAMTLVLMSSGIMASSIGFAAGTQLDIKNIVKNAIDIVFGVVVFGGVINIVRGISMIAKGLQDDGGGQDAAAISKGRGMLIAGIIMVAPEPVFMAITGGQSAGAFVASFF